MGKILAEDKITRRGEPSIPERQKFTADNYNEVKRVVNGHDDVIAELITTINDNHDLILVLTSQLEAINKVSVIDDPNYEIPGPGFYVYIGSSVGNWTLPPLGGQVKIKNRSGHDLTLTPQGSDRIYLTEERPSIIVFDGDDIVTLIAEDFWTK